MESPTKSTNPPAAKHSICCDLGQVAAALAAGGLAAVERLRVQPGNPVRVMLAQRLSDADQILARLGGRCAAECKYDGIRVQAHRAAQDATTTRELAQLFLTARRTPTGA